MQFPFYFVPESPPGTPIALGGNIILQGYGSSGLMLQGYGGSSPRIVEHPTLPAAILERFDSCGLADIVSGGLHYQVVSPSENDVLPFATMMEVLEVINENTKGPCDFVHHMQINFYVQTGDELLMDDIIAAWYANFNPKMAPLVWRRQKYIRLSNSDSRVITNNEDAPGGSEGQTVTLLQRIVEFQVLSSAKS